MSRHRAVRSAAFMTYALEQYHNDEAGYEHDISLSEIEYEYSSSSEDDDDSADAAADLDEEQLAIVLATVDLLRNEIGDQLTQNRLIRIVVRSDGDFDRALASARDALKPAALPKTGREHHHNSRKPRQKGKLKGKKKGPQFDGIAGESKFTTRSAATTRKQSLTPPREDAPVVPTLSKTQTQRDVQGLFERNRLGDNREQLHMIVVGHVDAGKSTLMGHTLLDLGEVQQHTINKFEKECQSLGKASFKYAWVLDETLEERRRGITMDVGSVRFVTKTKIVTLLDAPGHKDFIPNMISGVQQADVALLVVDAARGEFETGFGVGGQTREHAILVRSLGVSQLVVVVNKLDRVDWDEARFVQIRDKVGKFLQSVGYRIEAGVTFVPCSGLTGENLVKPPQDERLTSWYEGPTLAELIDAFKTPAREIDQPFRLTINDIFKSQQSGATFAGRIEAGALAPGDKIYVCPLKEPATVKKVQIDGCDQEVAFAGDTVAVVLGGLDLESVGIGSVMCDVKRPVPIATRFQVRLVVFNALAVPLTIGAPALMHHQGLEEPVSFVKLKALLNKQTGEVEKRHPRLLDNGACAKVVLQTNRSICVETFAACKALGRVTLRVDGVTIAAGVVTKVY